MSFGNFIRLTSFYRSDSLPQVDSNTMHPLLLRKRTLLLRIWAATCNHPLPTFRFSKFRRRAGRSFLQFEDEVSYDDQENDLDEVWSVQSYDDVSGSFFFGDQQEDVLNRLCGVPGDCGKLDCPASNAADTKTMMASSYSRGLVTRTETTEVDESEADKCLADLSMVEEGNDIIVDAAIVTPTNNGDTPDEAFRELDNNDASSVLDRITVVDDRRSGDPKVISPTMESSSDWNSNPLYAACAWMDTRCCCAEEVTPLSRPVAQPVEVSPEPPPTHPSPAAAAARLNESLLSLDENSQAELSIDELEQHNERLRSILEELNPRKTHSQRLRDTNKKLKAGIEFMKRRKLLDEYALLIEEYQRLSHEAMKS